MTHHIYAEYKGKTSHRTCETETMANIIKAACARHGVPCRVLTEVK